MRTGCAKSFGCCGYARRSATTTLPPRVSISMRSTSVVTTTRGAAAGLVAAVGVAAGVEGAGAVDGELALGTSPVLAVGGAFVSGELVVAATCGGGGGALL